MRVEPAPAPPVVLIEAWNELEEGAYILPTDEDGYSYGPAVAQAVGIPWVPPPKHTLTVALAGHGRVGQCSGTTPERVRIERTESRRDVRDPQPVPLRRQHPDRPTGILPRSRSRRRGRRPGGWVRRESARQTEAPARAGFVCMNGNGASIDRVASV
jgi:hypothetical protein